MQTDPLECAKTTERSDEDSAACRQGKAHHNTLEVQDVVGPAICQIKGRRNVEMFTDATTGK